jgi:hypothetical protein
MMQHADEARTAPKLNGMAHHIALGGLDGRLVAEAIELDHTQKMAVLSTT